VEFGATTRNNSCEGFTFDVWGWGLGAQSLGFGAATRQQSCEGLRFGDSLGLMVWGLGLGFKVWGLGLPPDSGPVRGLGLVRVWA